MNPESTSPTQVPPGTGARAFVVTSLVFLVLGMLMLAGRPGFLLTPVLTGHGVAWLDLLVFGFAFPAAFGVTYLAIPRTFGRPLFSEKFVYLHLGFHLAGTLLVIVAPLLPQLRQASMGPTFVAVGAIIFAVNVACSLRNLRVPDAGAAFLATALLWLMITAFFGTPFSDVPPLTIFAGAGWNAGWLALALGGFVFNAICGLALRVTPAALEVAESHPAPAWYALAFGNLGLAWLFAALAFGPMTFVLFCAGTSFVGALLFLGWFAALVQRTTSSVLGWDVRIFLASLSLVPVAIGLVGLAAWERLKIVAAPAAAAPAPVEEKTGLLPLEFLPVDGAVVLTVLLAIAIPALIGILFQIVRVEKGWTAGESGAPFSFRLGGQILLAAYFNYAVGVLMVIPAAWAGIEQILRLGTLFLLVGAAGFLGNYFYMAGKATAEPERSKEPVRA